MSQYMAQHPWLADNLFSKGKCPHCGLETLAGSVKVHIKACDPEQLAAGFWARVDHSAGVNGCWPWKLSRRWDGHHRAQTRGGQRRVGARLDWYH